MVECGLTSSLISPLDSYYRKIKTNNPETMLQRGPTKTAPLLINTIEMRVLWTEIKYGPVRTRFARAGPFRRILFWPPTLMTGSSAALWPLIKSLEALLMYFIFGQSTLISIVFISKGAVFVGPICMCGFRIDYMQLNNGMKNWSLVDKQTQGRTDVMSRIVI